MLPIACKKQLTRLTMTNSKKHNKKNKITPTALNKSLDNALSKNSVTLMDKN